MKSLTMDVMPPSAQDTATDASRTATCTSMNSPAGDNSNTGSTSAMAASTLLAEVNEALASWLVMYAEAGGQVLGLTLPEPQRLFRQTAHVIILPASYDLKAKTYSLLNHVQDSPTPTPAPAKVADPLAAT